MFLSCLFGEFPGVLALSCGFIADVTAGRKEKSRMARMAFIDCAINLAGVPAGLFAGQLLKRVGFTSVFGMSIGVNVLLPDPKKYKVREKSDSSKSKDTGKQNRGYSDTDESDGKNLPDIPTHATGESENSENTNNKKSINWDLFKPHKQIYEVYKLVTAKKRRHLVLPPLFAFSFVVYAFVGELTTTALYLKGDPLSFTPDFIGYYYASQGIIRSVGVVVTTQFAYRVLKASDINVLLFGIFSQIVCYVLIGTSKTKLAVFLSNLTGFIIPVALSLSRSFASKYVPPEKVGSLMAAFESLDALSFTTNLMSLKVYSATLDLYSGTVFLFLGGCSFVGLLITLANKFYMKIREKHERKEEHDQPKRDA